MIFIPVIEDLPVPEMFDILIKTKTGRFIVSRFSVHDKTYGIEHSEPWFWQSGSRMYTKEAVIAWCYIEES